VRGPLLLLIPLALVGVVGAIVVVVTRESDAAFIFRQEHPLSIEPSQLEQLVQKADDPLPAAHDAPAVSASCTPGREGQQRNPWRCRVTYESGHRIDYRIRVRPNGSYAGSDPTGVYGTRGCCLAGASPAG
jgi:hypothetical protein